MRISVIVPVFNEEASVKPLHQKLRDVLKNREYEVIFIDDGSRDETARNIRSVIEEDSNVKLIRFQRNFGKAAALSAGFEAASGEVIFTMDGDLQDEPSEIPHFLAELDKGHDMVSGWKRERKDPLGKRVASKFFNWLTGWVTGLDIHDFNCGFKAYRKEVVEHLNIYGELHRYIPALAYWHGFSVGEIPVQHHERKYGKSKYGVERLLKGFLDLLTVKFLMTYSKKPLHFFGLGGLFCFLLGVLAGIYLIYLKLLGQAIGERPMLVLCVLLIVVGLQFFSLGFLAEIISSQSRKDYIVRERINL